MLTQFIRRRRAIRSYVFKLSLELCERLGKRRYYTVDEVAGVVAKAGFDADFISYAHALFCARKDFDHYYRPVKGSCLYESLRAMVSRRYFGGVRDFDAEGILLANRRLKISPHFYESNIGTYGADLR